MRHFWWSLNIVHWYLMREEKSCLRTIVFDDRMTKVFGILHSQCIFPITKTVKKYVNFSLFPFQIFWPCPWADFFFSVSLPNSTSYNFAVFMPSLISFLLWHWEFSLRKWFKVKIEFFFRKTTFFPSIFSSNSKVRI